MSTATLLVPTTGSGAAACDPVIVKGRRVPVPGGPVIVALDDDGNAGALLEIGRDDAERLGVVLRVAYVWSDCRPPYCDHHRSCHRDLGEAARLLTTLLYEHVPVADTGEFERTVLHAPDPAQALVELSSSASLLVVGSSSDRPAVAGALGATTRAVLGRTRCPVVVVPYRYRYRPATRVRG